MALYDMVEIMVLLGADQDLTALSVGRVDTSREDFCYSANRCEQSERAAHNPVQRSPEYPGTAGMLRFQLLRGPRR